MVSTGLRPLEEDLMLDLRFKEGIGAKALDVSGNRNHGTIYNSPAWVSGGGLTLDGIDQYVQVTRHASLEPASALSLEVIVTPLFIETTNNIWDLLAGCLDYPDDGYGWLVGDDAVEYHFALSCSTGWKNKACNTSPIIDVEAHIVAVFNGTSIKVYYDGEPDGETNFGTCTINYPGSYDFLMCNNQGARWMEATVKLVRVYDVALSAEDVALLYAQRRRM